MEKLLVSLLVVLAAQTGLASYGVDLGSYMDGGGILQLPKEMPQTLTQRQIELLKAIRDADTFPYFEELRYLAEGNITLSAKCANDYLAILSGLYEVKPYAVQMLDSIGKLPAGLIKFNFFWMGMYEQCTHIIAKNESEEMFHGKYCKMNVGNFTLRGTGVDLPIRIGLCFPDSCRSSDAQIISDAGIRNISGGKLYSRTTSCIEAYPWTTEDTVATVLCGILGLCVVIGTTYDILRKNYQKEKKKSSNGKEIELQKHLQGQNGTANGVDHASNGSIDNSGKRRFVSTISQPDSDSVSELEKGSSRSSINITKSTLELVPEEQPEKKQRKPREALSHKLLMSFSALNNGTKLFNLRQNPEAMHCLNGVRALSISWIILGHTYNFSAFYVDNLMDWGDVMSRMTFQLIVSTFYAVDTFFFLSGFLVTIGALKLLQKRKMNWPMFYVHRYLRLTPVYAFLLMILCTLYLHMMDGPFNDETETNGPTTQNCYDNWWPNLIYINNFLPTNRAEQCMGWTWYLANDMQFFVVSPIFLFALHKKRWVGWLLIGAQWLSCVLLNGIIAYINDVPVGQLSDMTSSPYLDYMYRQPYYRIAPYMIGMALGDIIFHIMKSKRRVKIPPMLNMFLWVIALGLNLTMVYSQYSLYENRIQWDTTVAAIYYALSKTMWAVSMFYIVFACVTGHGGPINWFLSWRIWQPIARLSYAAYLVHPMVMYWYYGSAQMVLHSNDYNYIYFFLGHMCMSFAGAFILSILVEGPFMRLENILFGR